MFLRRLELVIIYLFTTEPYMPRCSIDDDVLIGEANIMTEAILVNFIMMRTWISVIKNIKSLD